MGGERSLLVLNVQDLIACSFLQQMTVACKPSFIPATKHSCRLLMHRRDEWHCCSDTAGDKHTMKCKMLGVLPELHRKNHTPGVLIATGVRLLGWAGLKNKQTNKKHFRYISKSISSVRAARIVVPDENFQSQAWNSDRARFVGNSTALLKPFKNSCFHLFQLLKCEHFCLSLF